MKFYSRKGILYVRINGQRRSTYLKDTPQNRKLITSYYRNDEFFNNFGIKNKKPKKLTDFCLEVLAEKEDTLKPSSYDAYLSMFNTNVSTYFKDTFITDIKPLDIKNFYKTFTDRSTLVTCNAVLKPAFELAILNEYIESNPMSSVSLPKFKSNYSSKPFTIDEMKTILNSADEEFKNLLAVCFFTGMRIGEVIALKWVDIDFENETINIDKTYSRGRIQEPKTKSSKAVIDLPFELLSFLKNQRLKTGLREFLFYNRRKNIPYVHTSSVSTKFKKLLKEINIEPRGIHQTRHTFASLKLSYGERLEWVSYMLRHKSPSITQDVYYKYIPRKKEKRVVFLLDDVAQIRHTCS